MIRKIILSSSERLLQAFTVIVLERQQMLGAIFAHNFSAAPTVMLPLSDAEVALAAVALVGRLVGRPIRSHRPAIAQLLRNLRSLLHLRHLQLAHAQLDAELFKCLLVLVVLPPQPVELGFRLLVLPRVLRVLADLQLQLRDDFFVLQLLRLQRRPPLPLNPQIGIATTAALLACRNLRR